MRYLLVENRTIVHLCTDWKARFIQSELDDLDLEYRCPPTDPGGYINLGNGFEMIPITEEDRPDIDPTYEHLAGPFYEYSAESVKEVYTKYDEHIEIIKSKLKPIVAAKRYAKEILGVKVTVQGMEVTVETDRDVRNVFVQKYMLMGDTESASWKFPEGWLDITKPELGLIIFTGATYIQDQFNWEKSINTTIDATDNIEDLKLLMSELETPPEVE